MFASVVYRVLWSFALFYARVSADALTPKRSVPVLSMLAYKEKLIVPHIHVIRVNVACNRVLDHLQAPDVL